MLTSLIPIFYIKVSPELLTVRNAKTGVTISEVPEIAISRESKPRIVGIGKKARLCGPATAVEILNPFSHPRSMVSDFTIGEQVLKAFIRRLCGNSIFAVSPRVVLHLMGEPDGGFTQVEIRAFQEMAIGAGASKVTIWQGRNLSDQELLSGRFPDSGQVLS